MKPEEGPSVILSYKKNNNQPTPQQLSGTYKSSKNLLELSVAYMPW